MNFGCKYSVWMNGSHIHSPLQDCFTEMFCHDLVISEFTELFMLHSKISVKIKSFIESIFKNIEKNFKPLPVAQQSKALTTTPCKLHKNETPKFLYI